MDGREQRTLRLPVAGARPQDVGKATVRLTQRALEALGISEGSVVEIVGKRSTAAIALAPHPEDDGLEVIRLDGLQRANDAVSMGDAVEVRRADVKPARRIQLAPAHKNLRLKGSGEALRRTLFGRPLVSGDVISTSVYRKTNGGEPAWFPEEVFRTFFELPAYALQEIRLVVTSTMPRGVVRVAEDTELELLPQYAEPEEQRPTDVCYEDIGGVGTLIDQVREMVELPLKHPELFQRLGIDPPKGVLLHGPPGTGKTLLARAVAREADAKFFHIAGPEIMGRYYGESEQRLREIFSQAAQEAPSIIFMDELDSIAPKRDQVTGEVERRVVAQLLTLMDGIEPRQNVVVIGATNRVDALDEALRRPGRFDREIVVGVPDEAGRREILGIHTRAMPLGLDVEVDDLAKLSYGFVGADLAAFCREAAIEALRRSLPSLSLTERELGPEVLEQLEVQRRDFDLALKRIQPSALREIRIQIPDVRWSDIGGLEETKRALREGIELPLTSPASFKRLGIRPARGFLLYGPPGTGKTMLAKAVAREAHANFISVKSSDLLSKWYGESEQQISRLFARARQVAPTVIFIDELDALAPSRGGAGGEPAVTERVVNTLLGEMDGLQALEGVVVIGATNRPNLLDPALLRPGRFDELVYVPLPEHAGRLEILQVHTRDMPLGLDVMLEELAQRTAGFTGADLEDLVRRAGLLALRENLRALEVSRLCFERALADARPSVSAEALREYEALAESVSKRQPKARRKIGFLAEAEAEAAPTP